MDSVYRLVKLNRLVSNHRVKFASVLLAHRLGFRHLFVRFDPVMACNLACTMCYFSNPEYVKQIKGVFSAAEIQRIAGLFFRKTLQLIIGCGTEPTLYEDFPEIVSLAKLYNVPFVGFTTNGQLVTAEHIEHFIDDRLDELTISVHGVRKETYERFMQRASFEKILETLRMLDAAKQRHRSDLPNLRINYTTNEENVDELRHFFEPFGKFHVKTLQVRPIIDFGGSYRTPLSEVAVKKYYEVIEQLSRECKVRRITFLANLTDPTYREENFQSMILQAVRRHITPQIVWRPDFEWRTESYDQFCDRIGWTKTLLKSVLSSREEVAKNNAGLWGRHAAKYDVIF